jgi:CRISPR-associated protein Csd1
MFKYEHSDGGCCLVTGDRASAARLHPALKGVRGANTTGASIISFNLPSFCSYGKEQSENAPVGPAAAFAYTTALNVLLGKDSRNKVGIGDATVVFWTQKLMPGVNFEDSFSSMFRIDKEDTDRGVAAVKSLFEAPATGRLPLDEGNRFYVLGLAPNAARISVRFWKTGTVGEFSERIRQHFIDFEIVRSSKDPEFLSLYQILCNTVLEYKMDNVPPKLAGDVVVSVLDGTPYPRTLLQQCMRRVRAERHVPRTRAAILKASINRFNRFYNKGAKEVLVALDRSNNDAGYRMGRLFAVLEKMQEEALGVETIRERFYGAASSTPVTVFPRLIKLSAHYLAKLHPGRKVNLEREMQEVLSEVQKFPAQFTLDAQAMFAIGYYHQRQDFFTKKDTDNK